MKTKDKTDREVVKTPLKGKTVKYTRRNGQKVNGEVLYGWQAVHNPRGLWLCMRVGDKGAADAYELDLRPSEATVVN